jgi:hypothetical protein
VNTAASLKPNTAESLRPKAQSETANTALIHGTYKKSPDGTVRALNKKLRTKNSELKT